MTTETCKIQLLHNTYEIKCPRDETNNLTQAARTLNDHLLAHKKKFKNLNEYQVLLLSALQVSHELVQCLQQLEQQHTHVSELIDALHLRMKNFHKAPVHKTSVKGFASKNTR